MTRQISRAVRKTVPLVLKAVDQLVKSAEAVSEQETGLTVATVRGHLNEDTENVTYRGEESTFIRQNSHIYRELMTYVTTEVLILLCNKFGLAHGSTEKCEPDFKNVL